MKLFHVASSLLLKRFQALWSPADGQLRASPGNAFPADWAFRIEIVGIKEDRPGSNATEASLCLCVLRLWCYQYF
jgi:hypothetical protein